MNDSGKLKDQKGGRKVHLTEMNFLEKKEREDRCAHVKKPFSKEKDTSASFFYFENSLNVELVLSNDERNLIQNTQQCLGGGLAMAWCFVTSQGVMVWVQSPRTMMIRYH